MPLPKMLSQYNNENFDNLACLIEQYERNGYGHMTVRFVYVKRIENLETVSGYEYQVGFFDDFAWEGECILNGLQITCQYNLYDEGSTESRRPYAFRFGYSEGRDFHTGKIEVIEMKLKFLKLMNRRIAKYEEKFGRISGTNEKNFGHFVKIVCGLFGVNIDFTERHIKGLTARPLPFEKIYQDIEQYINQMIEGS